MANTHGIADFAKELQATSADLLPACIVSTTFPAVPVPPGLVLAAFATQGYVRDGVDLVYCTQEAHTVTLTGGDGTYWLALAQDTWTTYAGWNRTAGTHYLWQLSATRPADVAGILVFQQLTVSGGNITAVSTPTGVTRAEALRALSGLGTMATQNANAVAITGGSAQLTRLDILNSSGNDVYGYVGSVAAAGGTSRYNLYLQGDAPNFMNGPLDCTKSAYFRTQIGVQVAPSGSVGLYLKWAKAAQYGMIVQPSDVDSGNPAIYFNNVAGTNVGYISTTATATSYSTSSDARLKHAIEPLTGALDVIRALNPITHLWKSDGSRGYSFLAHEVQETIPDGGVVTGEPDAVDDEGRILPQMYDPSKLVPWLTAALQEAMAQVEALTARVAQLEGAA